MNHNGWGGRQEERGSSANVSGVSDAAVLEPMSHRRPEGSWDSELNSYLSGGEGVGGGLRRHDARQSLEGLFSRAHFCGLLCVVSDTGREQRHFLARRYRGPAERVAEHF